MDATGVCVYLLVIFNLSVRASLISTKVDLCGPITELVLDQFDESSATIALASNDYTSICKLKIIAPQTHVIYLDIIETIPIELQRDIIGTSRTETCPLNVYQNESLEAVWSGDPCSNQPLSDIDLLYPTVSLEWIPPANPVHFKGKKLLVTAVGRGDACKDSLQHTCMSIGHEPLFCVSKYLLCDGNRNCPKGATRNDEDDKLCKITWSTFFKQFKNPDVNDKILNLLMQKTTKPPKIHPGWKDWKYVQRNEVTTSIPTTTVETQTSNIESLSAALSHYGPWGYILLGMLICGTVLMFCGFWECFRKPKPQVEPAQSSPTTVLIINQPEENSPPRYDDLDPPSYSTLFPNVKDDDPLQIVDGASGPSETNNQNQQPQEENSTITDENATPPTSNASTSASREDESEVTVANCLSNTNTVAINNTDVQTNIVNAHISCDSACENSQNPTSDSNCSNQPPVV